METPSPLCAATLELFASILGAEAGNLALKVLATGGVFVAVVFHREFCRYWIAGLLAGIPAQRASQPPPDGRARACHSESRGFDGRGSVRLPARRSALTVNRCQSTDREPNGACKLCSADRTTRPVPRPTACEMLGSYHERRRHSRIQ
jgi:hypothetical protein